MKRNEQLECGNCRFGYLVNTKKRKEKKNEEAKRKFAKGRKV
jgi:hypothetical protein